MNNSWRQLCLNCTWLRRPLSASVAHALRRSFSGRNGKDPTFAPPQLSCPLGPSSHVCSLCASVRPEPSCPTSSSVDADAHSSGSLCYLGQPRAPPASAERDWHPPLCTRQCPEGRVASSHLLRHAKRIWADTEKLGNHSQQNPLAEQPSTWL